MESVRWLRRCTPGPKLTTRNTVPLSSVVPTLRPEASLSPSLSTGNPSVVQILAACAPGRPCCTFLAISSIDTIAWPFLSWPVTTRRTVRDIGWVSMGRRNGEGLFAEGEVDCNELLTEQESFTVDFYTESGILV